MRTTSQFITLGASLLFALASISAIAEEPFPKSAPSTIDPARIDRDGKKICGFDLMTESEKAGHKNMMHQTKSLADRDEIRASHCAMMAKRAKEKGVTLEE